MASINNFIAGSFTSPSAPAQFIPITTPHSGAEIARCPISSPNEVDLAIQAAHLAFPSWSSRTVKDRASILLKFHSLIRDKYADELADIIVKEHGKTKAEALAEVAKGNETVEYACAMPELVSGRTQEVSRGVTCADARIPIGVVVSIVPFNFPFMVPFWTLPIALVLGNTVVLKPSEKVPLTMHRVAYILKESGVPDGVFNMVHGTAPVVNALIDHPSTSIVTFVGTSKVAQLVHQRAAALGKRCLALGGAKNHLVAAQDAKVEMAAVDIVNSFTGCTGQRCMAASVLLVIGENRSLIDSIVEHAMKITEHSMGPVIDQASLLNITKFVDEAEAGGATVLLDGRTWTKRMLRGHFVGPTVLVHKNAADRALHEEIFGPVLSILHVDTLDSALKIEAGNPFGNAACIYTQSGYIAEYASKRFSAGMIGVNIGVPVPREPFSFGGWNRSRFGTSDITADGGIELFTQRKKITTKWSVPDNRSWLN